LDQGDLDVGSSGTALLINTANGKKLLVGGSKGEVIFVLDRTNMGKFNSTDNVVQEFSVTSRSFSTPAFWNNTLYFFGAQFGDQRAATAFPFIQQPGFFAPAPKTKPTSPWGSRGAPPSFPQPPPATNGILWAIDSSNRGTNNTTAPAPFGNGSLTAGGPAV